MKKAVVCILVIAILAILFHLFLPWYAIMIAGAMGGYFVHPGGRLGLLCGFLAGLLVWGGYSMIANVQNEGLLAGRVGELFGGVPGGALPLVSGLIGAIAAGLGAMTGALSRKLWHEHF